MGVGLYGSTLDVKCMSFQLSAYPTFAHRPKLVPHRCTREVLAVLSDRWTQSGTMDYNDHRQSRCHIPHPSSANVDGEKARAQRKLSSY